LENNSKDIANSIGKLLTPEDIASLLSISPRTVYDYAQKGKIPAIKMLGQWRFKESDIVNWIESMQSSGGNNLQTSFTSPDQQYKEEFDDLIRQIIDQLDESTNDHLAIEAITIEGNISDELLRKGIEHLKKTGEIEIIKIKDGKSKIEAIKKRR
tara:strand:+ start:61 stop:525 length:465 start_codon:yes stop_codon:yes gene_type:complete